MKHVIVLVIGALLASSPPEPLRAETRFTGELDGPTVGSDSPATGQAELVLDDAQAEAAFHITYGNLVGEEIAAHLHAAPPGSFGPIIFELPLGTPKDGVWAVPPQRLPSLLAGEIYVVVHSDSYPAGEIGGWVSADQVAAAATAWSTVRGLFPAVSP
jgi:hypothetical protein